MSKSIKPYTIDDVNKIILAKPPLVHPEYEFFGAQNKYRDEDYDVYKVKRQLFYEAANKYRDLNKNALLHHNNKVDMSCMDILRYYDECDCDACPRQMRCDQEEPNTTGLVLRKRTLRPIHEDNNEMLEVCCLQPWFKRYLKLCKFIYATRTIIRKNRLLKNLAILRELNEETVAVYEAGHRKFENVSYPHVFEKFLE